MKKIVSSLVAVGAMVALAACGSSSSSTNAAGSSSAPATLGALVTAAKAEGSVDVYATIPADTLKAFASAFTAKYGIKVNYTNFDGATIFTRFSSETKAGAPTADILFSPEVGTWNALKAQGLVKGWSQTTGKYYPDLPKDQYLGTYNKAYDWANVQAVATGFIYNTNLMSEADLPKTWADLASSKYKGKVCFPVVGSNTSFDDFYDYIRKTTSDDVLRGIGANAVKRYPDVFGMDAGVAAGECAIGIDSAGFFVAPLKAKGAPVGFAPMPSSLDPTQVGVINATAAHPNAAMLFNYFVTSPEGNKIINYKGSFSYGTATGSLPAGFAVADPDADSQAQADRATLTSLLSGN